MTNPLRGEGSLRVGDQGYRLVLDVNAFCAAQEVLGQKAMEMVSTFSSDPDDFINLRGLFWAALQKHHGCHLLEAGEILADAGSAQVRGAMSQVLAAAFGLSEKSEGKEGENPPATTSGIG